MSLPAAACILLAAFAVSGSTSAAPPPHRKPATHAQVHHRSGSVLRAALARGHGRAPAPIPHVDPQLQVMPAAADGTIEVTLHGRAAALAAAVRKVGGRSIASAGDARTAIVPRSALAKLAGAPGVASVDRPVRAYPDVISEGVAASHADAWQAVDQKGNGIKVGVVDVGFASLSSEITAGNLPADTTVTDDCGGNVDNTDHGTAVAEIISQMAPSAQLFLYCIADAVGFQQAEQQIQAAGDIKIVNSSLGFPGDSRGDGTGSADSAATTVKTARQAGILWIQSAGNNGLDHWSGTLRDANGDGWVDLNGTRCDATVCNEVDAVDVLPGGSGTAVLKWDNWPTVSSAVPLELDAFGYQCNDASCSAPTPLNGGVPLTVSQAANETPVLAIALPTNSSGFDQEWDIVVDIGAGVPAVSYDLSYWGTVTNSFLSTVNPSRAVASSVTEPASSPYALGVGAADVQNSNSLEPFSSQGPTIDGRVKPDLTGFDDVSSNLGGDLNPFFGTSAAAPHVAGAAALVAGANPNMDAAQIQDFLERRAGTSPPNNQVGHGVLNLGLPSDITPPASYRYAALPSPARIMDTRNGTGGHTGALGAAQEVTVTVPGVPDDATAVAINLAGVAAKGNTFLAVYPGGSAWPGTSNLNLSAIDYGGSVFSVVTLGPGHTITVRNQAGSVHVIVDLLGYYGPSASGRYSPVAPLRVVDTRNGTGGHLGMLASKQSVQFSLPAGTGVPDDATSLVLNVVANGQPAVGYLAASPDCSGTSATVNYLKTYTRANLSITARDATGGFCIFNSGGPANVIVDLVGYIGPNGSAEYVPLPAPERIVDTRNGNGGWHGTLGSDTTVTYWAAGIADVPYSAVALQANVVATQPTTNSFLVAYSGDTRPGVSTLNDSAGRTVPNGAIVSVSNHTFNIYNRAGTVHAIVDVFGYYVAAPP
jgi:Subtilase family